MYDEEPDYEGEMRDEFKKRDATIAALKAEVERHKRALAAGPAALRKFGDEDVCARSALAEVETAQRRAMEEG